MNLLSRQEIAIVSDIAGTTRDILQVKMEIAGVGVTIYDTAGIRENAVDSIEEEGIRRAKVALDNADIKIYVFDSCKRSEQESFTVEKEAIVILNKSDLLNQTIDLPENGILFSARKPQNLDALLNKIESVIDERCSIASDAVVTTQQRQKEQLMECLNHLISINIEEPLEMTAQRIRLAVSAIEHIIGKITLDDVLDKIFSSFCIGK